MSSTRRHANGHGPINEERSAAGGWWSLQDRETDDEDRDCGLRDEREPELAVGEAALRGLDDIGDEIQSRRDQRDRPDNLRREA